MLSTSSSPEPVTMLHYMTKGDFADVIKLKNLRWGDYPGLTEQGQSNHKGPEKGKREVGESEQEKL